MPMCSDWKVIHKIEKASKLLQKSALPKNSTMAKTAMKVSKKKSSAFEKGSSYEGNKQG